MIETELRDYYENLFAPYPDVVDIPTFREMMGGLSEKVARRLVQTKEVKCFKILVTKREAYLIPKVCVVEYVISDAYQSFKHKLRNSI